MSTNRSSRSRQRLESGVSGLDDVLCGGLWQGSVNILQGSPGAGKTVLANQMGFAHAQRGGRCLYVTLLAESHDQILENLRTMSFYDEQHVSTAVYYVSAFSTFRSEGLKGLLRLISRERAQRGASLVVLDGMFALEEIGEPALEFRRAINELGNLASMTRTTVLLLTSGRRGAEHPEYTMADGWLELGQEQAGFRTLRYLQVHKTRGSDALGGRHQTEISDAGFEVFPRLESLQRIATRPPRGPRLSTGLDELDRILQGGIDSGAMGIVAGPTGVGKTSLALHFIGASSEREPGLIFGFYEDAADLFQKAESLGIDLKGLVDSRAVEVIWVPPVEGSIDEMAYKLLRAVGRRQVVRLLVDGMEAFRQMALHPERLGRFFTALSNALTAAKVTTLYTLELPEGSELQSRLAPVSAVADYVVMLRYVERASEVRRTLTIRKARRSRFDSRIREFSIRDGLLIGGVPGE